MNPFFFQLGEEAILGNVVLWKTPGCQGQVLPDEQSSRALQPGHGEELKRNGAFFSKINISKGRIGAEIGSSFFFVLAFLSTDLYVSYQLGRRF